MAIALSHQAYCELFEEVDQTQQYCDPTDDLDITWKHPKQLGEGWVREIQLREGLSLWIENSRQYNDIIVEFPENESPLEYLFLLSGIDCWENFSFSAGQYTFYGSGLAPKNSCTAFAVQPFLSVEVSIQPEILRSFVGKPTEELLPALQHLLRPSVEVPKQKIESKSVASVLRNFRPIKEIRQLSEIEIPSTNANLLVQSSAPNNPPFQGGSVVPITSVKANATDKDVEIILETTQGTQLQVTNRSAGSNFIADVSGGQLRLPSGEAFTFRSQKPLTGITEITVQNIDANTVQVTVVGVAALPTVELFDDNTGLVFGVTSAATAAQLPQTPPVAENPATQTPQELPAAQSDQLYLILGRLLIAVVRLVAVRMNRINYCQ